MVIVRSPGCLWNNSNGLRIAKLDKCNMVFCADRSWADAPEIGSSADKGLIRDAEVCRSTAKDVLEKISFSASRSESFFFMLDYAMKEGLFWPCGRKGESLSFSRNGKGGFHRSSTIYEERKTILRNWKGCLFLVLRA